MEKLVAVYVNETWSNGEARRQANELRAEGKFDRVTVRGCEVMAWKKA